MTFYENISSCDSSFKQIQDRPEICTFAKFTQEYFDAYCFHLHINIYSM